jgi:hypothetical protein
MTARAAAENVLPAGSAGRALSRSAGPLRTGRRILSMRASHSAVDHYTNKHEAEPERSLGQTFSPHRKLLDLDLLPSSRSGSCARELKGRMANCN